MRKSLIITIIIVLVLIGAISGIYYYVIRNNVVACTEDARLCPDGVTSVVRIPPKCEFEACPGEDSNIINNACLEIGCSERDVYAGSINSDKYYECKCRWAKSVNPENLVCFTTDAEAVGDGRTKSEC